VILENFWQIANGQTEAAVRCPLQVKIEYYCPKTLNQAGNWFEKWVFQVLKKTQNH